MAAKKELTNWGNFPSIEGVSMSFMSNDDLRYLINKNTNAIVRGLGRCYGDSSLAATVFSSAGFNKILDFDAAGATILCQSGVSFADLVDFLVPRGFFLPVTPGTKYITVGGAVASDVHGKNHHVDGSFCNHVREMSLMLDSGQIVICSRVQNSDLFQATCGGMGLTGVIMTVRFGLKRIASDHIEQVSLKAQNLDEVLQLFEQYRHATYSVAWIDCLQKGKTLGRSILMVGEHASTPPPTTNRTQKLSIPFFLPGWVLNKWSVKIFNFLYFHKQIRKKAKSKVRLDAFFYPLDSILHWNRMYGKKGFVQYQFVLPIGAGKEGLREVLTAIADSGRGSFLAVLKVFGKQDTGIISFPMEGYTLALDFPIQSGLFEFLDQLDLLVKKHGGRLYLTKDSRMSASFFESTYESMGEFKTVLRRWAPLGYWQSHQSNRLAMTKP